MYIHVVYKSARTITNKQLIRPVWDCIAGGGCPEGKERSRASRLHRSCAQLPSSGGNLSVVCSLHTCWRRCRVGYTLLNHDIRQVTESRKSTLPKIGHAEERR
ncbi:unnamed protein product [Ectocarpus sp. 13 AM-2016]